MWIPENVKINLIQKGFHPLDVKLKVIKKDNNRDFRLVEIFTIGETNFKTCMRLRNQLVTAAGKLGWKEKLWPVLIPTLSEDIDEQLNWAHKVVNVVDRL